MKTKFVLCVLLILSFLVVSNNYCRAEKVRPHKLSYKAAFYTGYDSNVNLSSSRNGDIFEEFLLSLYFVRPWIKGTRFTFDYDIDFLNYNDIRDATSVLHHIRLGVHKDFFRTLVGTGYDLGVINYPYNEDGDFLFHKGFFYIRKNLSRKMYHKLKLEYGLK